MSLVNYLQSIQIGCTGRQTVSSTAQQCKKKIIDLSISTYKATKLDSLFDYSEDEFDPYLSMSLNSNSSTKFNNQPSGSSKLLAVASEKGFVYIYRNLYDQCTFGTSCRKVMKWQAHCNAIFDIKWRPSYENELLTTSGDLSFRLWDLNKFSYIPNSIWANNFQPTKHQRHSHLSTIKSSSFCDENLFATGARDGHIKFWDIRSEPISIAQINDAHKVVPIGTKTPTRRKGMANIIHRSNPLSSVTCVLFKPNTFTLFSCGAGDPTIKQWDIRMVKKTDLNNPTIKPAPDFNFNKAPSPSTRGNRTPNGRIIKDAITKPFAQFTPPNVSIGQGYSCLTLDSSNRLYAACCDHNIYTFDYVNNYFAGTFNSPNYRSSSSNMTQIRTVNNQWLVAGSTSNCTPIWSLDSLKLNANDTRLVRLIKDNNKFTPEKTKNLMVHLSSPRKFSHKGLLEHGDEVTSIEVDDSTYELYTCCPEWINKWKLLQPISERNKEN